MWRRWLKTKVRLRLSTLILLIIIFGMAIALVLQQKREARLRSALRSARSLNDEAIRVALNQPFEAKFLARNPLARPPLDQLLTEIKRRTSNGVLWNGVPIYVDPIGLQEAGVTMASSVTVSSKAMPIKEALEEALGQLKLDYVVRDGFLCISSKESTDKPLGDELSFERMEDVP
jgi:hypothetical protein